MKGLEPLLREKPDPKSGASTNSATPACACVFEGAKIQLFYELHLRLICFSFATGHGTKGLASVFHVKGFA